MISIYRYTVYLAQISSDLSYKNKCTPNIIMDIPQSGGVHNQILTTATCPRWASIFSPYP